MYAFLLCEWLCTLVFSCLENGCHLDGSVQFFSLVFELWSCEWSYTLSVACLARGGVLVYVCAWWSCNSWVHSYSLAMFMIFLIGKFILLHPGNVWWSCECWCALLFPILRVISMWVVVNTSELLDCVGWHWCWYLTCHLVLNSRSPLTHNILICVCQWSIQYLLQLSISNIHGIVLFFVSIIMLSSVYLFIQLMLSKI